MFELRGRRPHPIAAAALPGAPPRVNRGPCAGRPLRQRRVGGVSDRGEEKALRSKSFLVAACLSLFCAASACGGPAVPALPAVPSARPFDGTLSLLTYNIEGAPWPFAWNRPPAF